MRDENNAPRSVVIMGSETQGQEVPTDGVVGRSSANIHSRMEDNNGGMSRILQLAAKLNANSFRESDAFVLVVSSRLEGAWSES